MAGRPWWGSRRSALAWLLGAAVVCALLILVIDLIFAHTTRGQRVDDAALRATVIGRRHIINPVHSLLDLVSVTALALAIVTLGVVAFLRRRPILALLAMSLVIGSNVTTEVLKHTLFTRPHLDPADVLAFNTLPSGHTTVALSVGVALALVAPARMRGTFAVIGAAYGAATGVATMSAGWHRPSDVVTACLVVAMWVALIGAAAIVLRPQHHASPDQEPDDRAYVRAVTFFCILASFLLAMGTVALVVTAFNVPVATSRPRQFLAYAGGASAVTGTALATMTGLLVVARRCRTEELDGQSATTQSSG